jgi:tetratricopeptide (TPR) repeat protein
LNSEKTFVIDTWPKRVCLLAAAFLCMTTAYFFAKWGLANTLAKVADEIEVAAAAERFAPGDPQTHFALAVLYDGIFDAADAETALREFEKAAALSPHNYLLWLELARALERNGEAARAEASLRRALDLAPNYSTVQWALGNVLLRQGRTEEALAEIRRAVMGDPKLTNAAAAMIWEVLGRDTGAFRNAAGDSAGMNAALAVMLVRDKRPDDAIAVWEAIPAEARSSLENDTKNEFSKLLIGEMRFRAAQRVIAEAEGEGLPETGRITNAGFESAVTPENAPVFEWQIPPGTSPKIALASDQKHSGNYSLLLVFGSANREFRPISQTVAAEPGARYRLRLFYRAQLTTDAHLRWEIANAATGTRLAATEPLAVSTDWAEAGVEFQAPTDSDGVIVRLVREGCDGPRCAVSGNIWFDDFELIRK